MARPLQDIQGHGAQIQTRDIDGLRLTLRRLEDASEPGEDPGAFGDLKQILLNRIAIRRAQEALASNDDQSIDRAA